MAVMCGIGLASSLLQQESYMSVASSEAGRADVKRVSSSSSPQLLQNGVGLRRTCRMPAFFVTEERLRSSLSHNSTYHVRGSKVQQLHAVADALNQTSDLDTLEGIDWDNFGFGLRPTDFMFVMKGDLEGNWQKGQLRPFGQLAKRCFYCRHL